MHNVFELILSFMYYIVNRSYKSQTGNQNKYFNIYFNKYSQSILINVNL